jgi:hypothetical protein
MITYRKVVVQVGGVVVSLYHRNKSVASRGRIDTSIVTGFSKFSEARPEKPPNGLLASTKFLTISDFFQDFSRFFIQILVCIFMISKILQVFYSFIRFKGKNHLFQLFMYLL